MPTNPTWENTVEEVTPAWDDTTDERPGAGATRDFKTPAQAEKLQRQFLPTAISEDQWAGMSERAARDEQNRLAGNAMNEAGTGLTTALYQELPAAIGTAMHDAGTAIYEGGVNAIANRLPEFYDDPNEIAQQYDTETAIRSLPTGQRIFARAGEGLVKSTPQMAVALVNPYAGALAFGFTPEGFSVKHAALAAALPFIGTKSGAVVENIAARLGMSSEAALMAVNKLGGATGAAAVISADEAYRISQLPETEQGEAWIDATANIASQMVLGTLGPTQRLKNTDKVLGERASANAETMRAIERDFNRRNASPADEGADVPTWDATTAKISPAAQEMPAPIMTSPSRAVETTQAASADAAGVKLTTETQRAQSSSPQGTGTAAGQIERIVTLAREERGAPPSIVESRELKGTDGKWYRANGFPSGVDSTGELRVVGYVQKMKDGTTAGKTFKTREEAEQFQKENQSGRDEDFRAALREMSQEQLQSQEKFWNSEIERKKSRLKPLPPLQPKKQKSAKPAETPVAAVAKETSASIQAEINRLEAQRKAEAAKPRTTARAVEMQRSINWSLQSSIDLLKTRLQDLKENQRAASPAPAPKPAPAPAAPSAVVRPSAVKPTPPSPPATPPVAGLERFIAAHAKAKAEMDAAEQKAIAADEAYQKASDGSDAPATTKAWNKKNDAMVDLTKAKSAFSAAEGELALERHRVGWSHQYGQPDPVSDPKITPKVLKAQKEYLMDHLTQAIKDAPEDGTGKITISVPGDGEFTLINTKASLKKFKDEGAKQFPTTVGKSGPGLPAVNAKAAAKVADAKPEDFGKIAGEFVSDEPARVGIQTAYADGTQIIATDGRQLLRIVTDKAPGKPGEPVRIDAKGKVEAKNDDHKNYPNWKAVIPNNPDLLVGGVDTAKLHHIARQAEVFRNTSVEDASQRGNYPMELWVNPDRSLGGRMEIQVDINKKATTETFEHNLQPGAKRLGNYNPDYILTAANAARRLGSETVDFLADNNGPLVIRGKTHESVVSPFRMNKGSDVVRDTIPPAMTGQKTHARLVEGFGPLKDPDLTITRQPDIGAAGDVKVELTAGKLEVFQGKLESNYRGQKEMRWKSVGELPGEQWPTAKGQQDATAKKLIKEAIFHNVDVRGSVAKKLADSINSALAERKEILDEIAQRKGKPAGINTGNLGESGMGGAKPGEFRNSPTTPTGIRNAIVDGERIKRGLPPAMDAARKDFGTVWDEAMARVDQDPTVTERLVAELQQKPRAASDVENALLLHRQIELQNEYGKLTRDLAQAFDDSASFPNRLADVETFKARVAETSDKLLALYDVGKVVGTEQGRGLASRKMLAFEDYSLAKMEMEKRAAKGGASLSDAERAQVAALQERIQRTESEFQAYREKQDAERANRMTDEAIRDMQEELKRRPNYDSRIVKIAEEIVVKLEKQAVSAQQRLKEKFRRTNTGLDPTIIYDLGVMGAAKIARAGLDFAKFSAEMVAELGDGVKPYMQAAWERANLHLENEGAKYGDKSPLVKAALRKRDASGKRENVIEGLKKGAKEGLPVQMEGDYIRQLAEGFVAAGIKTREPLVDAVHEVLTKEVGLEITRRETMDAISGYGKFKPLNPDAVKATLRELRGQMQQVAKLEDIQSRTPLKKTGVERRTVGDEERRLLQQVNEAKRRFGVVVDDPARQLKSALDAIKTRLKNQVADIEYQINTKARIVKTKSAAPFDAETKLLELRRDELRSQLDELLPKPGLTPEQQAAQVARGIERSIADYERRIAGKDVTGPDKKPTLTTPALEALRARRDALKAEWTELRDVLDPGRRERASLASLKARLAQSTASYVERLAKHDFSKRKRNEPPRLDAEALKLKAENELAKREYHHGLIMDRMANRTTGQRVYAGVKEALNLPRNLLSSWDVSAVLRQGGFISLGNPLRAGRSLAPMFRALASEKAAVMIEQEILSRPNAPLYKQSKLYLAPHEALHLSAMEEAIMSRVAGKIPGLRASNRAYITFLNRLRADSFDSLLASVSRKDGSLTPPEMQAIANYINVATGRGDLGKAAAAAETLATVFFSPRLVASRFQLLAGQPMYRGSFRTRQAIAQEYGKFLAGIGVVLGLGIMAGATVERDPRNSDFGKLKFGNTRLDVLGGLGQVTTLVGRLATGETVNASGEVKPIRGEVPYGSRTGADVIAAFLRSKLSPVVGTGVDIVSGKNAVGEPVTPRSVAINMTVPLSFRDIYDVMQDQGMERGTALGVLSLFGFGLQHYEANKSNPVIEAYMRRIRGVTPEQRAAIRKMLEEAVKK